MADLFRSDDARPDYSPEHIYLSSTDRQGHYRQTKLHITPDTASRIAAVVERPDSPYRSRQDFYRDAIVHRLLWVASNLDMSEDFRQWVGEFTARSMIETQLEMLKSRQETRDLCQSLLMKDSSPAAKEVVRAYVMALPDCPERDELANRL